MRVAVGLVAIYLFVKELNQWFNCLSHSVAGNQIRLFGFWYALIHRSWIIVGVRRLFYGNG